MLKESITQPKGRRRSGMPRSLWDYEWDMKRDLFPEPFAFRDREMRK